MAERLRLAIITGSTRKGRMGEAVARWFASLAAERPELEVVPVDLRDLPLPFYDEPRSAKAAEKVYALPEQRRWVELVGGCDAFVVVTPEYNHGYPAALKNALDHVYAGWNGKPVGFVSYGGSSGGVRAVEQLRLVAIELQLAPLRDEVNIPMIASALDPEGRPKETRHELRAAALLDQLVWWGEALREGRRRRPYPGTAPPAPPVPRT